MKQIAKILSASLLILACLPAMAQNGKNDAYRDFLKQRNKEYTDWRSKANAEFSDYLEKAWKEFSVQMAKADPIGPVPEKPTYFEDKRTAEAIPYVHGLPSSEDMCLPANFHSSTLSAEFDPSENNIKVNFFGADTDIPFDNGMMLSRVEANEKGTANAWKTLSNTTFLPTIDALTAIRTQYALSDWAMYMLIKTLTESVYSEDKENERIISQFFLLLQMQYKARIGSFGNSLVLLIPFKEPVYQISYVSDGGLDLFIFGYARLGSQAPLSTFQNDFSEAKSLMSLTIPAPMKIGGVEKYKKIKQPLWSSILGEDFSVPVNQPYINFTLDYPQSDLVIYHHSAVDSETAKAVLRAVKYKILKDGMNQEQAVAYILNLIQNGFEYKTDYELFGRSKPLFIEESFYYGANNCKDRVLIFSWLVKKTLNLNTIMFGYPNHVACGVEFTNPVEGDAFNYKGHKYVMCDPTYINAYIGATMPKFKGMNPSFIEL